MSKYLYPPAVESLVLLNNSYKSPCSLCLNWQKGSFATFPHAADLTSEQPCDITCFVFHNMPSPSAWCLGHQTHRTREMPVSVPRAPGLKSYSRQHTPQSHYKWSCLVFCMLHDLPISHFFSFFTTWGWCMGFHVLVGKKSGLFSECIQHVLSAGWDSAPGLQGQNCIGNVSKED